MQGLIRLLVPLALALALFSGCGTGVFTHRFEISVSDSSGRLGTPPMEMSIFNPQRGRSEEWARKTSGTAAPGAPFVASYDAVETRMMLDSSPAERVTAALWLPAYERAGYFNLALAPHASQEATVTLPFTPWSDNYLEGAKVVPLTARVRSEAGDRAWIFHITIEIP